MGDETEFIAKRLEMEKTKMTTSNYHLDKRGESDSEHPLIGPNPAQLRPRHYQTFYKIVEDKGYSVRTTTDAHDCKLCDSGPMALATFNDLVEKLRNKYPDVPLKEL